MTATDEQRQPYDRIWDWERFLDAPLRWRKPGMARLKGDLFEGTPFDLLDRVFAVMALRPDVVFQVLTKRPERMREYLTSADRMYVLRSSIEEWLTEDDCRLRWPLPNVWLGTSTENQHWLDVRIPELLATPAAVRFVSAEPLLGRVDLRPFLPATLPALDRAVSGRRGACIDWVVVGGESGPGARPCDVAWVRSVVSQCRAAGVAVFVKQLGSKPYDLHATCADTHEPEECWPKGTRFEQGQWPRLTSRKGSDMTEWPEDLRVREFPEGGALVHEEAA